MSDRATEWADVARELAVSTPLSSADVAEFVYQVQAIGVDDPAEALRLASHAIAVGFDPASYVRLYRDVLAMQTQLRAIGQGAGWPVTARSIRLPRAIQRVGCEHPSPLDVTFLGDPAPLSRCFACQAEWMEWPKVIRW